MKKAILSSLVLMSSFAAAGGTESSGGGGAMVCRDPVTTAIKSAQLYDLFEGTIISKYQITMTNATDANTQLVDAVNQLSTYPWLKSVVMGSAPDIINRIKFLPAGLVFGPPPDMGPGIVVESGCAIEGVGYYDPDGTLEISPDIYNAFTNTDRAAMILHEGIYKFDRQNHGGTTSTYSRSVVAALFATNAPASVFQTAATWAMPDWGTNPAYSNAMPFGISNGSVAGPGPYSDLQITLSANLPAGHKFYGMAGCSDVYLTQGGAVTANSYGTTDGSSWTTVNIDIPDQPCPVLYLFAMDENAAESDGVASWEFNVNSGGTSVYDSGQQLFGTTYVTAYFRIGIPHPDIAVPTIPSAPPGN